MILASLSGDAEIGKYYADAKEEEFLSWHNQVSDWEIRTVPDLDLTTPSQNH